MIFFRVATSGGAGDVFFMALRVGGPLEIPPCVSEMVILHYKHPNTFSSLFVFGV